MRRKNKNTLRIIYISLITLLLLVAITLTTFIFVGIHSAYQPNVPSKNSTPVMQFEEDILSENKLTENIEEAILLDALASYDDSKYAFEKIDFEGNEMTSEAQTPEKSSDSSSINQNISTVTGEFYATYLNDEIIDTITGLSYPDTGTSPLICYDDLCLLHVTYVDFNNNNQPGELICNKSIAADLLDIFQELYENNYQIESIRLIDEFDADDERSMKANNTSCFNYRTVSGSDKLSNHSFGCAIDINPFYNPYVTKSGIQPEGSEPYADRTADFPHKITSDDLAYKLFTAHGFTWGGNYKSVKDYQHFEKETYTPSQNSITVVIDPGHGGSNGGGTYGNYLEKKLTPVVASYMKRELEKYDGIKVVMTHTEDVDLSLTERVLVAKESNADFLYCLHFNMSKNHNQHGSECWISAFGENYARGMDFSQFEMKRLTELGLFDRGIKTRKNSRGTDYYGIIRQSTEYNIPSVIIEHCFMDNPADQPFLADERWLKVYGKLDATAVAEYYGLKSEMLGRDYSNNTYIKTEIPEVPMFMELDDTLMPKEDRAIN